MNQTFALSENNLSKMTGTFAESLILLNTYSDNYMVDNHIPKPQRDAMCEQNIKSCIYILGNLPLVDKKSIKVDITPEQVDIIKSWGRLEEHFYQVVGARIKVDGSNYDAFTFELNKFNKENI